MSHHYWFGVIVGVGIGIGIGSGLRGLLGRRRRR